MKQKTINTRLDIYQFIAAVETMADDYFDFDGNYQPHIGLLNAMRVFYNMCYIKAQNNASNSEEIVDLSGVDEIAKDSEFCTAFYETINSCPVDELGFATAYRTALDIVDERKRSVSKIAEAAKTAIDGILTYLREEIKPEEVEMVVDASKKIAGDGNYADNIIQAYMDSQAYKHALAQDAKQEVESK